jgi:hypothetical protein
MVGRIKISTQADAVRHLFMALEKDARQIKDCWFCGSPLSTMKLANQGSLAGNHRNSCPFEELAAAAEHCIHLRNSGDLERQAAESALTASISNFLNAMAASKLPCPFPICRYSSGHRLECPFHAFEGKTHRR